LYLGEINDRQETSWSRKPAVFDNERQQLTDPEKIFAPCFQSVPSPAHPHAYRPLSSLNQKGRRAHRAAAPMEKRCAAFHRQRPVL
jgi:hypothetical protein